MRYAYIESSKLSNLHAGLPLYLETWENMQKPGIWQLKVKALENLEFDKSKKKLEKPGIFNMFTC